jgi:S1-C subfamily serine protease
MRDVIRNVSKEQPKSNSRARLMTVVLLAIAVMGGNAWYINYVSRKASEASKQTQTVPSSIVDKGKAKESDPTTIELKNVTITTSERPKTTDVQIPATPQVPGHPPLIFEPEQEQMNLEKLAVTVIPCVFSIEVFDATGGSIGKGTGFSISTDGFVVTNHHVIQNGQTYSLVTSQGAKFDKAEVVVSDPDTDLAIIKIEAKDFPYLSLADSSKIPIGKRVAVYGSPQGLAGSLSEGIISASERNLSESFPDEKIPNKGVLIQTTSPISPGSSGSPLFDAEGKVLGVMTLSLLRNSQSLNFAIPVEALKPLMDRAKSSWLFVRPTPLTSAEEASADATKVDVMIEAEPAYRRLRQQMNVNNWVESLKIARFLAEKYPKSSLAHFLNGNCASMLRLDHQAEMSYTKAVEFDPLNQFAWCNLGLSFLRQKQLQSALLAFEKAVSLNPDYPQAWDNILRINVLLSNWPKATTALNTLAQIDLKTARENARMLINFRVPDASFRQALERLLILKVDNIASSSHIKFRVVGVLPNDPLSVRAGPGISFSRVISVANGAEVLVTGGGRMNGTTEWLPINFGKFSGWVVRKHLQSTE